MEMRNSNMQREEILTNFNGGNSKATSFKHDADTTGGNAFAKPTNHSSSHQYVLHLRN